jgi:transcriptional regulator with XRE-family HTH domain
MVYFLGEKIATVPVVLLSTCVRAVDDIQRRFGSHLRKVRSRRAVSQEKLADLAGLHRTYISSVERGQRNVTLQTVEKLAAALLVTMAELMPDSQTFDNGN